MCRKLHFIIIFIFGLLLYTANTSAHQHTHFIVMDTINRFWSNTQHSLQYSGGNGNKIITYNVGDTVQFSCEQISKIVHPSTWFQDCRHRLEFMPRCSTRTCFFSMSLEIFDDNTSWACVVLKGDLCYSSETYTFRLNDTQKNNTDTSMDKANVVRFDASQNFTFTCEDEQSVRAILVPNKVMYYYNNDGSNYLTRIQDGTRSVCLRYSTDIGNKLIQRELYDYNIYLNNNSAYSLEGKGVDWKVVGAGCGIMLFLAGGPLFYIYIKLYYRRKSVKSVTDDSIDSQIYEEINEIEIHNARFFGDTDEYNYVYDHIVVRPEREQNSEIQCTCKRIDTNETNLPKNIQQPFRVLHSNK